MSVLVAQLCPTLWDPVDCSLPGSSIHGILQARILEWVAIPFSGVSSWHRDWTHISCILGRFYIPWKICSLRNLRLLLTDGKLNITKLAVVYEMQRFCLFFNFFELWDIRWNVIWCMCVLQNACHNTCCCCCLVTKSCLTPLWPHELCQSGSSVHGISQARILEWAAISFSRGSSQLRDQTCVSCIGREILFHESTGKP